MAKAVAQGCVDVATALRLRSAARDMAWAESSLLTATLGWESSLLALVSQKLCKNSGSGGVMMICS